MDNTLTPAAGGGDEQAEAMAVTPLGKLLILLVLLGGGFAAWTYGLNFLRARVEQNASPAGQVDSEGGCGHHARFVGLALRRVTRNGQDVRLTPTEWGILELLVRNPEKLVTQQQLLTEISGAAYTKEANYLRVYMAQLRRKLEPEPGTPRHFLTETGIGYRFQP